MDFDYKLSDNDLAKIRQELFEIAEANRGHTYNLEVAGRLGILMIEVNRTQIKNLTIDIMKTYIHRPALIRELDKLLYKNEKEAFANWRAKTGSKGLQSICKECGSTKIAKILYGLPDYDEVLEKKLNSGKLTLGGCSPDEFNYECANCEARYIVRPTEIYAV